MRDCAVPRLKRTTIAAALALSLGTGCKVLIDVPPLDASPAPYRAPPPPEPETCASWKPTGKLDTPSAAELRPLLGLATNSPEVEKVMRRLGPSEILRGQGRIGHVWRHRGVEMSFHQGLHGEKLDRINLLGRVDYHEGYAPKLPDELSFTLTKEEVDRSLGEPDTPFCDPYQECLYQSRGLLVVHDRRKCLDWVALIPIVDQTKAHFENVAIQQNVKRGTSHGIAISFVLTAPVRRGYPTVIATACIDDEKGQPRKLPAGARSKKRADEPLCVSANDATSRHPMRKEMFVPYAMLEQAAGPFLFKVRLEAALSSAPAYGYTAPSQRQRVALEPVGTDHFELTVPMPEMRRARFSVRRAEVDKNVKLDDFDTAKVVAAFVTGGASMLVPKSYERPDLLWMVYAGGARIYKSPAIQDSYTAVWGTSSPPVLLAPDDEITICLEDEDVEDTDRIACFQLTLDSYMAQVKSGKPLSQGAVTRLVLGPAVISK